MGFLSYFYIAVFIILFLFIVYDLIISIVNTQKIKKIDNKVAVKKSIKFDVWWIILSAINVFLNFSQYRMALRTDDTDARLYLLAFSSWTLCGIGHIVMIFLDRYIYITPEGIFYKSNIKIQPKDKYRYRIDGDILELYYKTNITPIKYKIAGNKEKLSIMLDENYAKYTGD